MANQALAVAVMSGDFGPRVLIPALVRFLSAHRNIRAFAVGQQNVIEPLLKTVKPDVLSRIILVNAPDIVAMDEQPAHILRRKKQSSMSVAIDLVAEAKADAVVSAGNTGGLMALSMHKITRIENVYRPAICGQLPTLARHSYLLDMGANVDLSANELLQFAKMAEVLAKTVDARPSPTVALLNIGEEAIQGNEQVKHPDQLLQQQRDSGMQYIGYVEAHKLYNGVADIIVCDGFVGNIAFKASEGVASYILEKLRQQFKQDWLFKLMSLFAAPPFLQFKHKVDPRRYNGAMLLGLNGLVIKSHGHADEIAFYHALCHAQNMLQHNLVAALNQIDL